MFTVFIIIYFVDVPVITPVLAKNKEIDFYIIIYFKSRFIFEVRSDFSFVKLSLFCVYILKPLNILKYTLGCVSRRRDSRVVDL